MQELHAEHQRIKARMGECEETASSALLEQKAAEGSAQEHLAKAAHYQEQIAQVTTQREYGALLNEIDAAKKLASDFEEKALEAIEIVDTANSEKESLETEFQEVDSKYQIELAEWEEEKPQVAEEMDRLEAEADVLRAKLPKPILLAYERLYERLGGNPLAKIQPLGASGSGWRCSTCNYAIRPQVVVQLRAANELVPCTCGRQLYIDPADA
ncbi:MAG: hypothetical protein AAGK22_00195 [Acidobacteriota bacterium]